MASHRCDQCGAVVAADEQFCPNCGSFIDPLVSGPAPRRDNVISVNSDGNYEEFDLGAAPPVERPRRGQGGNGPDVTCPSCGAVNPANNRHCQECGARLSQGPLPTAPRPAVQATAGVRAALAISALLFAVVVIALLFNVFNGDGGAAQTTTTVASTTSTSLAELSPIEVIRTECLPDDPVGAFVCANLTSGTDEEYQITWEELDPQQLRITLTFRQPMAVQRIDWTNLADETQFRRNYRARGLLIEADDSVQAVPIEVPDEPGTHSINFASISTNAIEITVTSAWNAEVIDDNVFREMAVQEITVIGRPANVTNTTLPEDATTTIPEETTTTTPGTTTTS